MIELLIEYPSIHNYDNAIIITMIHGDDPMMEVIIGIWCMIERKFIKYATTYEKFITYEIPSMKLYKYGWSLRRNHEMVGPIVCNIKGQWGGAYIRIKR
jgi:hypothetical protein